MKRGRRAVRSVPAEMLFAAMFVPKLGESEGGCDEEGAGSVAVAADAALAAVCDEVPEEFKGVQVGSMSRLFGDR